MIYESVSGGGLAGSELPASWEIEGSAMRRVLAREFAAVPGVSVVMTLDSRLPLESSRATTLRVSSPDEPIEHARHVNHTVIVAPESAEALAELAERIDRSLGCMPEAIRLTGDKLRFSEHLNAAGIPTPPTMKITPANGLPTDVTFPAVLKPIDGAGSVDTWLISSHESADLANYPHAEAILQPFVAGESRSASFLVDSSGDPHLLGVCRQDVECVQNRFHYGGGTLLPESLPDDHTAFAAVRSVKGLRGWVGVDYIQTEPGGSAVVLELNPRATTSCVAILAVLEPGEAASAWLDDVAEGSTWPIARPQQPLHFRADGTILSPL